MGVMAASMMGKRSSAFAKKPLFPSNDRYSYPRMSPFPPNQKMSGFSPWLKIAAEAHRQKTPRR